MTENHSGVDESSVGRRSLLVGAAAVTGAAALGPLDALAARSAQAGTGEATRRPFSPDYGPLRPVRDQTTGLPLLRLPRGFEYVTYGWFGDPMSDGVPTPSAHDGMGAYVMSGGPRGRDRVHLVRNHEVEEFPGRFTDPAYDPDSGGGTVTISFDPGRGEFLESYGSLSGTERNCAGGITPWGTWLTCEESLEVNPRSGKKHGYIFEVPRAGKGDPTPLRAMGRFVHEAVAVDPHRGFVYETEDASPAGFFRFRPNVPGRLAKGGVLEMLRIGDATHDTSTDPMGTEYRDTSWVRIDEPDPEADEPSPTQQGMAKGAAVFSRLEGAFYGNGLVYIVSTSGGPTGLGQVFEYNPRNGRLRVLFASPNPNVLKNPDNMCVSPRGGLVLCEDGEGVQFLQGLTADGQIFPFAANNIVLPDGVPGRPAIDPADWRQGEFCGSVFQPGTGQWLFVNVQSPGVTFAITGPWRNGSL